MKTTSEIQQRRVWDLLRDNGYENVTLTVDPMYGDVKLAGLKGSIVVERTMTSEHLTAMTDEQVLEWIQAEFR